MSGNDELESQVDQMLSAGHSHKAEKAVCRFVVGMTAEQVKSEEPLLRNLSSRFLPAHKKRHRKLEALISRQLAAKTQNAQVQPGRPVVESQQQVAVAIDRPYKESSVDAREREFQALVAEMKPLGFTKSAEVSRYIIQHRLGNKYQHISGVLTMEQDGDQWDFQGGFPPKVYARLCDELGLGNQGSAARPVDFVPFSDLGF